MDIATSCEGKVITSVTGLEAGSDNIIIRFEDQSYIEFWHSQDCCESVYVNDVDGDESDLVGGTLQWIDESVNDTNYDDEWRSGTWTFYRIATSKGVVVVRWLGESNGYYSESVSYKVYN